MLSISQGSLVPPAFLQVSVPARDHTLASVAQTSPQKAEDQAFRRRTWCVPMDFPFADAPGIIRANQKDAFVELDLRQQVRDVVQYLKGVRFLNAWTPQLDACSTLLYLGLTTLLGSRTLGEEYTDIFYLTSDRKLPSKLRLTLYVLTSSLGPIALAKVAAKLRARLRQDEFSDEEDEKWYADYISPASIVSVNLALFYFSGAYYQVSKRIFGLRYAFGYRVDPLSQPNGNYALVGLLMVLRALGNLVSKLRARLPDAHNASEKYEDVTTIGASLEDENILPFIRSDSRRCNLCLEDMTAPTSTLCGHLYCWSCIAQWCRDQAECPLCRQECHEQHLLCLRV